MWILHFALVFSIIGCVAPLSSITALRRLTRPIFYLAFLFPLLSLISLSACFAVSDFSVLSVVNNSHTSKPMIYKISGAWGNHEGSMLLWITSFSFFSALFAYCNSINNTLIQKTLSIQSFLNTFFIAFTVFSSNPFLRIFPAPKNGLGLNPILQDIGLALHPPMLYLGYVGFSLIYSGAVSTLIEGKIDKSFSSIFRPWILMSWTFLTLGICLGSWWAYRELGWGGFWFWDAVENSSLMPWLTATALIHTLIVFGKNEEQKNWVLLLSISTFTLCMVGTFLVRSGIITSVHAFVQDPRRGLYILSFLGVITTFALTLYSYRVVSGSIALRSARLLSRESFIILNNVFFSIAAFVVIFGTLYPSVIEIFKGQKIYVGAPYFNLLCSPLAIIISSLTIIGTSLNWKHSTLNMLIKKNAKVLSLSIISAIVICYSFKIRSGTTFLGVISSLWLIIGMLKYLVDRRRSITLGALSMFLSHLGFGILAFSIFIFSSLEKENESAIKISESIEVGKFRFVLKNISLSHEKNYLSRKAEVDVYKHSDFITKLYPETRFFTVELQQTTESSIYNSLFYDLYVATGELNDRGYLTIRVYFRPMVSWIWFSGFLIFVGGGLGFFNRLRSRNVRIH